MASAYCKYFSCLLLNEALHKPGFSSLNLPWSGEAGRLERSEFGRMLPHHVRQFKCRGVYCQLFISFIVANTTLTLHLHPHFRQIQRRRDGSPVIALFFMILYPQCFHTSVPHGLRRPWKCLSGVFAIGLPIGAGQNWNGLGALGLDYSLHCS